MIIATRYFYCLTATELGRAAFFLVNDLAKNWQYNSGALQSFRGEDSSRLRTCRMLLRGGPWVVEYVSYILRTEYL